MRRITRTDMSRALRLCLRKAKVILALQRSVLKGDGCVLMGAPSFLPNTVSALNFYTVDISHHP